MITSFVDDSGSHGDSQSYVLSAFYTTPRHWEQILREWLGMVHRYGVTAFHATDCANGGKEFEGWSNLRKKKMFRNLINILTHHFSLYGCSAAVVLKDYKEVVYPEADQLFGGPKVLAFQLLVLEVAKRAGQPVTFIMDKPSQGWGTIDDMFGKTKALHRNWAANLHGLIPGNAIMFPGIQTADLLAYETYRELAEKEKAKTGPRRKLRRSLWRLMVEKSLTGPYFEKDGLLRLIEQCKKDGKLK